MGAIEIMLAIVASWVLVVVVFIAGFLVGRTTGKFAGDLPKTIIRRGGKVQPPQEAAQPQVPGIDVKAERQKIIARAKQTYGMNDTKAGEFADQIIRLGSATLGRLHQKG